MSMNDIKGRAKGGVARAEALTPEQRREIAKRAAAARWNEDLPRAEHPGTLRIGDMEFPCAVLSDGTRILTETDFMRGMDMYRSGALSVRRQVAEEGARLPLYLAFKNLKPFIDKHLGDVHVQPLKYRTLSGTIAHGIPAEIIPKICDVWLDARKEGILGPRQEQIAAKAEILIRALARIGIIALIDEATGFQNVRARDALARILEAFIAKELRPWVRTFPEEFYEQLFRLRGLKYPRDTVSRPLYFGHLTNDIVYKRLAPKVLDELKKIVERTSTGRPKHKYFQRLTEDIGHPKLREHLAGVISVMKLADNYPQFINMLNRTHPPFNTTLELPFDIDIGDTGL